MWCFVFVKAIRFPQARLAPSHEVLHFQINTINTFPWLISSQAEAILWTTIWSWENARWWPSSRIKCSSCPGKLTGGGGRGRGCLKWEGCSGTHGQWVVNLAWGIRSQQTLRDANTSAGRAPVLIGHVTDLKLLFNLQAQSKNCMGPLYGEKRPNYKAISKQVLICVSRKKLAIEQTTEEEASSWVENRDDLWPACWGMGRSAECRKSCQKGRSRKGRDVGTHWPGSCSLALYTLSPDVTASAT